MYILKKNTSHRGANTPFPSPHSNTPLIESIDNLYLKASQNICEMKIFIQMKIAQ
jgi:hypothetical protein